jgi:hypothetical protein
VEVVSWFTCQAEGLTAYAEVLDIQGQCVWSKSSLVTIGADQTVRCFPIECPSDISDVYFIRLKLKDSEGRAVSENIYWQGREKGNLKALHEVAEASVKGRIERRTTGCEEFISVDLVNNGDSPAMMLRLKVKDSETGDLVLPVVYSDNYFFLMPGESKTVEISVRKEDLRGKTELYIEGFNLNEKQL